MSYRRRNGRHGLAPQDLAMLRDCIDFAAGKVPLKDAVIAAVSKASDLGRSERVIQAIRRLSDEEIQMLAEFE